MKLDDSGLSGLLLDWEFMLALMVGSELASTVTLVAVLLGWELMLALMVGSELASTVALDTGIVLTAGVGAWEVLLVL